MRKKKNLFYGLKNLNFVYSSFYWIRPPTFLYAFFVFCWFALIIYSHFILYRALKGASLLKRAQIKYFFLATAAGFAGGGFSFSMCFGANIYPYYNFTVPLYPITCSSATGASQTRYGPAAYPSP